MAGNRDQWFKRFEQMASGLVITPHEGEFARLFPEIAPAQGTSKIDRAVEAARISGMTVVLKGPDTVVAAPDGRSSLSTNAPLPQHFEQLGDIVEMQAGRRFIQNVKRVARSRAWTIPWPV